MDSGLNLVEHMLLGKLLVIRPSEIQSGLDINHSEFNDRLPVGRRGGRRVSLLKGYFSLNDFHAWAACNGQNSKE